MAVLEALVDACPQSAEVPSKDGETPIMISFRRAMLQAAEPSSSSPSSLSFPSEREVALLARLAGEALLTAVVVRILQHGPPARLMEVASPPTLFLPRVVQTLPWSTKLLLLVKIRQLILLFCDFLTPPGLLLPEGGGVALVRSSSPEHLQTLSLRLN